jgi:hypothetical protein
MKRFFYSLFLVSLALTACTGRVEPTVASTDGSADQSVVDKSYPPRKRAADHKVIIMLGEEYAKRPAILEPLIAEYGLSGFGGMTVPLKYPESFTVGQRTRLAVLAEHAAVSGVTIIVTIGAPEGTVNELKKIRSINPSARIVTLFSFDDILPVEAISDIVAMNPRDDKLLSDESASNPSLAADDASLGLLVLASVLAAEELPASETVASETAASETPSVVLTAAFKSASDLMKLKKTAPFWAVTDWADPDTGLKSRKNLCVAFVPGTVQ